MPITPELFPHYEPVPDLDTPRYQLGDVAVAAGVSPGTLKAWLVREPHVVPLGPHDQKGRGKGIVRLLTLRRIYAIALTSELIRLGFVPSRAGYFGFVFTEMESFEGKRTVEIQVGPRVILRDVPPSDPRIARAHQADIEHVGPLFFAAYPGEDSFNIFGSGAATLDQVMDWDWEDRPVSAAVVNCTALMERVRTRLKERGV